MIFEGFEGPFSQSKSIKNRFQVELAMKCTPRRPQDVSRRPQDAPKTPQDSQDDPKTAPRRAQDAPKMPPGRPQGAPRRLPGVENFGFKNGFLADPLQTSILERLGLDFGRFWHRFWEVLSSVFRRFSECLGHRFWKFFGYMATSRGASEPRSGAARYRQARSRAPDSLNPPIFSQAASRGATQPRSGAARY